MNEELYPKIDSFDSSIRTSIKNITVVPLITLKTVNILSDNMIKVEQLLGLYLLENNNLDNFLKTLNILEHDIEYIKLFLCRWTELNL